MVTIEKGWQNKNFKYLEHQLSLQRPRRTNLTTQPYLDQAAFYLAFATACVDVVQIANEESELSIIASNLVSIFNHIRRVIQVGRFAGYIQARFVEDGSKTNGGGI